MAFPVMAAVAGGGALLSYFGQKETNAANKQIAQDTNDANAMLAAENRAWQERMANTAHEREVTDLRKAGLNPILSATGGSGAASPSGGAATMQAARMENALGQGVSSALASANLQKDLEMADSQKALNASAVQLQDTQKSVNYANATKTMADTDVSLLTRDQKSLQNKALDSQLAAVKEQAQVDLLRAKMDKKMVNFDAINRRAQSTLDTANSAKDLINPFKGVFSGPRGETREKWKGRDEREAESRENMRKNAEALFRKD